MSPRPNVIRAAVLAASVPAVIVAGVLAQQMPVRDAGQQRSIGTAVIAGVVVTDDADARPVRRAHVNLTNSEIREASRAALTDDQGRFVVPGLPGGRYSVSVSKPGWVTAYYGAKRPGRGPAMPLALADGQTIGNLSIRIMRGAVIAGRIVNQFGAPQAGLRPVVLEYRTSGGQRMLRQVIASPAGFMSQTDDRGEYRVYGLPPGAYVVAATPFGVVVGRGVRVNSPEELRWALQPPSTAGAPPGGPRPGGTVLYGTVYYPGTIDAVDAATITLGPGEERSGVDFAVRPVPVSRVEGTLRRADGQPVRTPQVALTPVQEGLIVSSLGMTTNRASIDPSGTFTFAAVQPGRYLLTARAPSRPPAPPERPAPGQPARRQTATLDLWASTEVTVQGDDITGLALTLEPGMTVSGRIVFEKTTLEPPSDLSRVRLQMGPPDMRMLGSLAGLNLYLGSAAPDATFSIPGVSPGRYVLSAFIPQTSGAGPDWVVKSIAVKDQNVLDRPFDVRGGEDVSGVIVTLSDRVTEISGLLQDALGRPAPEYSVFVIPADRTFWGAMSSRMRPPTRPASDGRYRIRGLPAGEYFVAALGDVEEADYNDAAFLEQVAAAAFKITLAEGEKKQQDLQLRGSMPASLSRPPLSPALTR